MKEIRSEVRDKGLGWTVEGINEAKGRKRTKGAEGTLAESVEIKSEFLNMTVELGSVKSSRKGISWGRRGS